MKKIIFKVVRLPFPWILRSIMSKIINLAHLFKKKENVKDLNLNGFRYVNSFLSEEKVELIMIELNKLSIHDQWKNQNVEFNLSNVPDTCHVGHYKKSEFLSIDLIKNIVNDPNLKKIADSYLGGNSLLIDTSIWWSFGGKKNPEEAEFFHRDIDNLQWLKFFIYLTDVDKDSGPHVFIPKSHRSWKKLQFCRLTDVEAKLKFGDPKVFVGKKGDLIIEDTFGIHKGQFISKNNNRLILQFQYASLPRLY